MHHGNNLKRIREMLGIKQEYLATSLNLSQQAISQLEHKKIFDTVTLEKVSKVLDVPQTAIVNLTEKAAVNIISTAFSGNSRTPPARVNSEPSFHPLEKIVELYERMLKIEREKNELLERLLKKQL